ncbi:MAG TPA: C25 family cysteine peptidase, partial [Flavisolibacter sp.]
MKNLFTVILIGFGLLAQGQVYNNEWINHSQTYYKFKVGRNGVHRISQTVLSAAGLGTTPAEQFQLWRNGVQVPIFTSIATGTFGTGDYIEFWGQQNDGKPDRELYRNPSFHLNDKWSLESDTSAYFLTVHTNTGNNLRLTTTPNNVSGTTLPVEPSFMYTAGKYFRDQLNMGYAVNVGEYLYSSSYDRGEGWTSSNITSTSSQAGVTYGSNTQTLSNLYVFNGGPTPTFRISVSGNAINPRRYRVNINTDSVFGRQVDFFNYSVDTTSFPLTVISSNEAVVTVTNISGIGCIPLPSGGVTCQNDRLVIHKYEINYPRQFNFGGASNFEFTLPESIDGNYLQISNFNYGSTAPVLYDITNGKRYVGDITAAPVVKFVLEPSATERQLVLVSQEASNVTAINTLEARNFKNYAAPANVGDYLIITHPVLFNSTTGANPIDQYRQYRSSATGGSFNVQVYIADELIDQFGFGIHKNPAAIRNFIRFARNNFPIAPKHIFIIGKGVVYRDQRILEPLSAVYQENLAKLNLVPTFGSPASDQLLTAEPGSSLPLIPIGRLSVINGDEVAVYLDKVMQYEQAQAVVSPAIADKAWMKNVVHIVGVNEPVLGAIIDQYMDNYGNVIRDTLFGGKVTTFSKTSASAVQQLSTTHLQNLFTEGISLITYFGHSSATTLEFNLDVPDNYNNPGKYPLFFGLGCNAGNFYTYNTARFAVKETLSEKYVLAKDRGVIGFVASTHFGIVHYLNLWAEQAYREIS